MKRYLTIDSWESNTLTDTVYGVIPDNRNLVVTHVS